jgi:GntR family transcriptional regulator, transcriptional repressor for pyruvate dehydrogenase complex
VAETPPLPAARAALTAPQQIAGSIKDWIRNGSVRPGDRLPPEPELAVLFGTSRPTVRAALQELCATDVLTVRRGRTGGYRVSEISLELLAPRITEFLTLSLTVKTLELPQVYEVRRALEMLIAELAAERRTPEGLSQLERIVADGEASRPRSSAAAIDLDLRFHRRLARCTGNPLLVGLEDAMDSAYRQFLSQSRKVVSPRRAIAGLADVTAAVAAQDAAGARAAMELHLSYSDELFRPAAPKKARRSSRQRPAAG